MKSFSTGKGFFACRPLTILRSVTTIVLIVLMGLEILPLGYEELDRTAREGSDSRTLSIEPLQVCDRGDTYLGALFDTPLLVPGVLCLLATTERLPLFQHGVALLPEGFRPAIDHPPEFPG